MSDGSNIFSTLTVSGYGMRAQSERVRVIAQNIANSDTAPLQPGELPYTRQQITFKNQMDRIAKEKLVKVDSIKQDTKAEYKLKYMPGHPAADESGYVKMPNVNNLIETMDMKEANRSYEANLGMFNQTREMMNRTIGLLQ
jgi:flagellar basal-body rod protein FlgC